ncbi:MAG: hypothetical protein ACOZCL_15215 [Bacillota bacterium]
MNMHELILMLQYEVQKSLDFIDSTSGKKTDDTSILHISLERVEMELPISISEKEVIFDPKALKGMPQVYKRLQLPYTSAAAEGKTYIPKKVVKGRGIETKILGPIDKLDDKLEKEFIGRIKVVMKPIIK